MKRIKLGEIFCLARFVDRLLVDRPAEESFATLTRLNMDDIGEFIPRSCTFSDFLTP